MKKTLKIHKGNPIWTLVKDSPGERVICKWFGKWDNKKMKTEKGE